MYDYSCKILKVIDGDTLDIEIDLGFNIFVKERVRLSNVNTPEIFGKNATEEGKLASDSVIKWVEEHSADKIIYISRSYNTRDKYGRCLGEIVAYQKDSIVKYSLNQFLINNGWGI